MGSGDRGVVQETDRIRVSSAVSAENIQWKRTQAGQAPTDVRPATTHNQQDWANASQSRWNRQF